MITLHFQVVTKVHFSEFCFYVAEGQWFDADDYAAAYGMNRSELDPQDVHAAQDAAGHLNPGEWLEVTHAQA
jgi:hypothetical protein